MNSVPDNLKPVLADLLLAVADDKLMLGHRNSDWTGLGPILEEDIAFSSIAQDEIAHAQALYEFAGTLLGRTADTLAFGRDPEAYRCAALVVRPDDFDWATAIARQFFCDHFDALRLGRLARSSCPDLAALSSRLAAEEQVHVEHVDGWVQRLGRGTEESHQRLQASLDALAPIAPMLLEPTDGEQTLADAGIYPPLDASGDAGMFDAWANSLRAVVDAAGLTLELSPPAPDVPGERGGRRGRHPDDLVAVLDEMCEVYRTAPEAAW